jgi:hypothetical protein
VVARAPAVASVVVVAPIALRLKGTHNDDPHDSVGPKYAAHFELEGFRADIGAEQVTTIFMLFNLLRSSITCLMHTTCVHILCSNGLVLYGCSAVRRVCLCNSATCARVCVSLSGAALCVMRRY